MKYLVVIGDGMADFPIDSLGGRTPLMAAKKPNIDRIARAGYCGQAVTVPEGFSPGSDVACMSLFGYDPAKYYTGRAPLEAYAMGITMGETDVAFRCNLVYLEPRLPQILMGDYSAGHISTEEAKIIVTDLNEAMGNEDLKFYPGVGYRHILIWKNGKSAMTTTPPHDISGQEIAGYMPAGDGAEQVTKLISDSQIFLKTHAVNRDRENAGKAPANSIWLWGQGKKPYYPTFYEKHGVRGAVVAAVDLVKGVGAVAGFDTPQIDGATGYLDTDYEGKARKALELLEKNDIVYVHVEAPDEASHSGNLPEKIKAIENIDELVVGFLMDRIGDDVRLLIATDHATPISTKTHYGCPVPFAIFQKGRTFGGGGTYDETNGGTIFSGEELIEFFLKGLN